METTAGNVCEIMEKLVNYETNIWACIYRAVDHCFKEKGAPDNTYVNHS
jgi:hypothetical protein